MKKINELPESQSEFWDGEKYSGKRVNVPICEGHKKNWIDHNGYKDNHDGTASCVYCGWGFRIPGYLRVHEGKIFDLRVAQP